MSGLCDDATYPGDEPLRPSKEFTKVLSQDELEGGRASVLMQRLGFADTKTTAAAARKNAPKPVTAMRKTAREPGEDDAGTGAVLEGRGRGDQLMHPHAEHEDCACSGCVDLAAKFKAQN